MNRKMFEYVVVVDYRFSGRLGGKYVAQRG
jgi:hypothetical protein